MCGSQWFKRNPSLKVCFVHPFIHFYSDSTVEAIDKISATVTYLHRKTIVLIATATVSLLVPIKEADISVRIENRQIC